VDITLSSDDETAHSSLPDAAAEQKVLASDDTRDDGVTSVEPTAPGPIRSGVLDKPKPFAANQAAIVPPVGGRGQKCPLACKQTKPIPQSAQ
jgi:hypothetical protein